MMRPCKKYQNYQQLIKAFEHWEVESIMTESLFDSMMQLKCNWNKSKGARDSSIFSGERKGIRETYTISASHIA
jgi:hypothetical protein